MQFFLLLAWVFALIGILQHYFGVLLVERFVVQKNSALPNPPGVSVLKPLCGVEPLTETALESFFLIDYPQFQLVFGVQDSTDSVLNIIAKLRARYPTRDVALVTDAREHGSNRKVSNLINMLPAARYHTLVMSDADIHVPPYFLHAVTCALAEPGVGLVTTLYTALPGTPHLATALGASQINATFLPGALLARKLGRQDCLGVTMALRQSVLDEIGGLQAIANHLADDQVLGRLVCAKGYSLTLAPVIPATTVPEASFKPLFRHELRWARTIRALVPIPYAASVLQFSLVWALLGLALSGFSLWGWGLLITALLLRYLLAKRISIALGLAKVDEAWLCLLRDFVSLSVYIVSFFGDKVNWRGQIITVDPGRPEIVAQCPSA